MRWLFADGARVGPAEGQVPVFDSIDSDIKLDCQMVAKIPDDSDTAGPGTKLVKFVKSVVLPYSSRRQSVVENGVKYNIKELSESFSLLGLSKQVSDNSLEASVPINV